MRIGFRESMELKEPLSNDATPSASEQTATAAGSERPSVVIVPRYHTCGTAHKG